MAKGLFKVAPRRLWQTNHMLSSNINRNVLQIVVSRCCCACRRESLTTLKYQVRWLGD